MDCGLIDRQALLDAIEKDVFASDSVKSFVRCVAKGLPTIDSVPVVHGEWMEENSRPRSMQFVCSVCHRTSYDQQPTRDKAWRKRCRYAYCPNCGARMDGERRET